MAIGVLALTGCEYDVPLTAKPTRATQEQLVGTWLSVDEKDTMTVRRLDEKTYVVSYNGDLYAAHHSDLGAAPFVSVLHLDPENRKYALLDWALSDEGRRLRLRLVSSKVIPADLRDSTALQARVRQSLTSPGLFGSEHHYVRKP